MSEGFEVSHNRGESQFEIGAGGEEGKLQYEEREGVIRFLHTIVPGSLEGKGRGSALARAGLDYARDNELAVQPLCPFVAAYIDDHPEYAPLLAA